MEPAAWALREASSLTRSSTPPRNHGISFQMTAPTLLLTGATGAPSPLSAGVQNVDDEDDMTVCHYYQRGTCKFGDRCKNEHPGSQRDAGNAFGGGNRGGFNAFGGGADRYRPSGGNGAFSGNRSAPPRFNLSKDDMKADLTDQRPIYPFSCYGPGRDAPRQLMEGPVEISPEELRSHYYSQRASGNEATAQQEENQLFAKTEEQVKSILSDLDGAIKYVEDGADVHPNRIDIAQGKVVPSATSAAPSSNPSPFSNAAASPFGGNQTQTSTPANPFGGANQTQNTSFGKPANPFGQASALGQNTSAFGQTSALGAGTGFGKPSMPGSAFGQASALGGGSAFGKPSPLGGAGGGGSAFGQTSSLGQQSTFGQPSAPGSTPAFGQASTPAATSAFGKPSVPGQTPAFGQTSAPGQTSAFGQASAPGQTSAFGQASTPGQPSAFGQANALGQNNAFGNKPAFGQSAFGQTSQPGTAANPFANAGQAGQTQAASSPFANTQTQTTPAPANPFVAAAHNTSSTPAFGQAGGLARPSPFAAAAQNSAPTAPKANPFASAAQNTLSGPAFGAPTQPANLFAQAGQQAPAQLPAAAAAASGPVDPFKEGRPEDYQGEQGQKLQEIYQRVAQMGIFDADEDIPLVPPKSEWITMLTLPAAK